MNYSLFTDGGARGNPGPAAIGVIIKKDDVSIFELGKYLGKCTNNEAEYVALMHGLKAAIDLKIKKITCFLDSELVVKQLNGQYKVKNENLRKFFDIVKKFEKQFDSLQFTHVKREKNKEADALVNKTLDNKQYE